MSEYIVAKTVFKKEHVDCLVQALEDVQPQWKGHVEQHETAANLYGYHGDKRKDTAHLIVRRQFIGGSSNDIGYRVQDDGTVTAVISAFDRGRYDEAWANKLAQHYAFRVAEKQAAKIGATITKSVNPDGTWRVVLQKKEQKAWAQARRW